jgi:hypothetical protein
MITEIDLLTRDLYKAITFENGTLPDFSSLKILFFGEGILINNCFAKPIVFTADSFIKEMEAQIADANIQQFMEREVFGKTEIFGKVAQRISVYEYSFSAHLGERLPRGVNFIQYVQVEGNWRVTSMVWSDENENNIIPAEWLVA